MLDYNNAAIDQLAKNELIPLLFSHILSVGNVLNGGTDEGQADGFNLEILTKISQIKDKNNHSILQFVCQLIKATLPEFDKVSKQFIDVKNAFSYPFNDMKKRSSQAH